MWMYNNKINRNYTLQTVSKQRTHNIKVNQEQIKSTIYVIKKTFLFKLTLKKIIMMICLYWATGLLTKGKWISNINTGKCQGSWQDWQ